jgi:hypothetical protein
MAVFSEKPWTILLWNGTINRKKYLRRVEYAI